MKPIELTMQAFGSYGKKTRIDFEKPVQNLFLITGDTGAGKSTIFDAIVFALYGEASSTANRKEGEVLQSQFADLGTEPFVELRFEEDYGAGKGIYTVRRVPAHRRPVTRGANKGESRKVNSSVTLFLPDGKEYPSREADRKLEEIVGLSKGQFMQVAMIAQGEFMELLRARSDDKKVIFRRLFGTELFQRIVEELNNRKKAREEELKTLKTECQTLVPRLVIPEGYAGGEELADLKEKVAEGSLGQLGELLGQLEALLQELQGKKEESASFFQEKNRNRDQKRDAYQSAEHLLLFFKQLDQAREELAECRAAEGERKASALLMGKIRSAYEVSASYDGYQEAESNLQKLRMGLEQQTCLLPRLTASAEDLGKKEQEAEAFYGQKLEAFSMVSERVEKALEVFGKISVCRKEMKGYQEALDAAQLEAQKARQQLEDLDSREGQWKERQKELEGVEQTFLLWKEERKRVSEYREELSDLKKGETQILQARKTARKLLADYQAAKDRYLVEKEEYEGKRQAFLDAQAGFLASKLEDGKPCPVCGSLTHPHPFQWSGNHGEISEEALEALEQRVEALRLAQEDLAGRSGSQRASLEEKDSAWKARAEKLAGRLRRDLAEKSDERSWLKGLKLPEMLKRSENPEAWENLETEELFSFVSDWEQALEKSGLRLKADVEELRGIRKSLEEAGDLQNQLKALVETANQKLTASLAELKGSESRLHSLEESRTYPTEAAARADSKRAQEEKNEADRAYQKIRAEALQARGEVERAKTLIQNYQQELPRKQEQTDLKKSAYEELLTQKALSREEWKRLIETYRKQDADRLQEEQQAYDRKLEAAKKLEKAAAEAIAGRERPQLEALRREMETAQKELDEAWQEAKKS